MATNPASRLCVVCSQCQVPSSEAGGELGGDFLSHPQFSQFCGELEICAEDFNDSSEVDNDRFAADGFLGTLHKCRDKVCVCSNCLSMITRAVDKKLEMDEVEHQVVKMQVELLRKLEALKECTDLYWREMEGILRRVNQSEVTCFEEDEEKLLGDVLLFKERIIDVVIALGIFRGEMETKMLLRSRKSKSKANSQPTDCPLRMDFDEDSFQDFEDIGSNHGDSSGRNSPNEQVNEGNVLEMEDTSLNQNTPEAELNIKEEPREDDYLEEDDHDQMHSEENDSEWEETPSPKKPTKLQKSKSFTTLALTRARKRRKRNSIKNLPNSILLRQLDFSKMSPSKAQVITRILKPPCTRPSSSSKSEYHDLLDPDAQWKYDHVKDQLTLAGIPISISETTEGTPSTVTLHCHHPNCTFTLSFPMTNVFNLVAKQKAFFNHVVSTHTNLFQCSKCTYKAVNLVRYNAHMIHHADPDQLKCSKCELLFFTQRNLLRHEQSCTGAQVASTGCHGTWEKCNQCGKTFQGGFAFRKHAETHMKPEERPKMDCPSCGMTILQCNYSAHKCGRCPAKFKEKFGQICDLCGKAFKTSQGLKEHKERLHNENGVTTRDHLCTDCGLAFHLPRDLQRHRKRKHEKITKTRILCRMGCGQTFTRGSSRLLHEKICTKNKNSLIQNMEFVKMGPAKQQIIKQILQPFKSKLDYKEQLNWIEDWKYDQEKDQMTIASIPISILEEDSNVTFHCHHPSCNYTRSFEQPNKVRVVAMQKKLYDHVLSSHTNLFQCSKCSHKAKNLLTFNAHVIHHNNPGKLQCAKCGILFLMTRGIKKHQEFCTGNPLVEATASHGSWQECKICGKKFTQGSHFRAHAETHLKREDRPKITCPLCGLEVLKLQYSFHKKKACPKRESKTEPLICDICGKRFKSPHTRYLEEHKERLHGLKEKKYLCSLCGMGFGFTKDLIAHRKSVHGEKVVELECRKGCGKYFYREGNRDKHESICEGPN